MSALVLCVLGTVRFNLTTRNDSAQDCRTAGSRGARSRNGKTPDAKVSFYPLPQYFQRLCARCSPNALSVVVARKALGNGH